MKSYRSRKIANYKEFTILVMSFMYVYIGVKHFTDPQYFINITPPQIEYKSFAVYFTGALEVLGGFLILNKKTRKAGAYILIFLLFAVSALLPVLPAVPVLAPGFLPPPPAAFSVPAPPRSSPLAAAFSALDSDSCVRRLAFVAWRGGFAASSDFLTSFPLRAPGETEVQKQALRL